MVFEGSSNSEILDPVLEKREPGVNWEKAEGGEWAVSVGSLNGSKYQAGDFQESSHLLEVFWVLTC